ncbi:MAG: tetratricopeptide repeat protein [Rhodospirillaceae bacterium]
MKSRASMIALSLMLATGIVGVDAVVAPPAMAQKAPSVSPKVGKPLQAAQEALKKKAFKEAVAAAEQAAAVSGKTPYETYLVNEILAIAYIQSGNYARGVAAWEASLATGQMPPEQQQERIKQLAAVNYQSKNYPKAIEYAQRYLKEVRPGDADMTVLIGQSHYLQKNYKQAAESLRAAVKGADTGKRNPEKVWLELLMSAEYELGNQDAVAATMERLITLYPDPKYFAQFVQMSERTLRGTPHVELDVARIKFHSGIMATDREYTTMAEIALQEGLPCEGKAVIERGTKAGIMGQPANKEREARLLALATKQCEADTKTLPQGVAEAAKQAKGDATVKFGEAYWSMGDNEKAVELINAGIAKGVDNKDDAQLRLGIAHISAGRRAEGLAAFKSITPGSQAEKVAGLWRIYSGQPKKG